MKYSFIVLLLFYTTTILSQNVGVGLNNPEEDLHVQGTTLLEKNSSSNNPQLHIRDIGYGFARLTMSNTSQTPHYTLAALTNDDTLSSRFHIYDSFLGNMLSVAGTGRVGIRVSNPEATLHVNSFSGDDLMRIQNNGATKFRIFSNNAISFGSNWSSPIPNVVRFANPNVFIGFSSSHVPVSRFEVDGKVSATGLKITGGATDGYVLKSDALGNATWQPDLVGSGSGAGQLSFNETFTISTTAVTPGFGRSAKISGNTAYAGSAPLNSVYKFTNDANGWSLSNNGSGPNDSHFFGWSLDLSPSRYMVGDPYEDNFVGKIYFYSYSACCLTPLAEASPSDGQTNDLFGHEVAFAGDYVAAASPFKNSNAGKVYIYYYDGTDLINEVSIAGSGTERMGSALSMDGDLLAIGAPNLSPSTAGKVYLYERSGSNWNLMQTLTGPSFGQFGKSVHLSGNKLAVGGDALVQVFVNNAGTWSLEQDITPIYSEGSDIYGNSVSIEGDHLVIGAPLFDVNTSLDAGAVYYYSFDGSQWIFQQLFIAPDASAGDNMGTFVDIDGVHMISGSPTVDINGEINVGKAFIKPLN